MSELLERINQPLVVALDGGWGSGKSHFLKLWTGAHGIENSGTARVIYFDAFEHDYLDDPLISLVGAIVKSEHKASGAKATLRSVQKAAMKLARPTARIGFALLTAGGTELAGAVADEGIKAAGKSAEDAFDAFWQKESGRMAAMEEFRQALAKLTAPKTGEDTPQKLIFIIDELDRCRPDCALALLEIIKHFFAVPNVHFVLGTNLTALENSVKARYGQGIDATQYLQKFVHLVMQFQKPLRGPIGGIALSYFEAVANKYKLPDGYAEGIRRLLERLATKRNVSLRDVQRLLTQAALLPDELGSMYGGYATLICGALFLRVIDPHLYVRLRSGAFKFSEIETSLGLRKPIAGDADQIEYAAMIDWIAWSRAIQGHPSQLSEIPEDFLSYARDVFGSGRAIRWDDIAYHFATAFDSYTLPSQP